VTHKLDLAERSHRCRTVDCHGMSSISERVLRADVYATVDQSVMIVNAACIDDERFYSPSPFGRGRGEGQAEPGRALMRVGVRTKPYGYDAGVKEPLHLAFTKPYSA
jgi:hypothetical protein